MQIPVEQFPVLTPGQMNPFNQAMQSGLQAYQNNMSTIYKPYQLQADIAAKQAYANNYGRQMAAQVLSTPGAVAGMKPEQVQALVNMMSSSASGSQRPLIGLPGEAGGPFSWLRGGSSAPQTPVAQTYNDYTDTPSSGASTSSNQGTDSTTATNETDENNPPKTPAENMVDNAQRAVSGNVMTGKGKGVGAGTVYTDPATGTQYSSLTESNVGPTQASILATERAAPYIKSLGDNYEKAAPGIENWGHRGMEGLFSFLTSGHTPTPYQSATGAMTSSAKSASEALIKDFTLNATGGNREALEAIVQPAPLESVQGYKERLSWLYQQFANRDKAGREALLKGIRLNRNSVYSPQGRNQLSNDAALSDGIDNKNKASRDPAGAWPRGKEPVNESAVQGQMPPAGTKWMVRPDGVQVAVREERMDEAKTNSNYRDIN